MDLFDECDLFFMWNMKLKPAFIMLLLWWSAGKVDCANSSDKTEPSASANPQSQGASSRVSRSANAENPQKGAADIFVLPLDKPAPPDFNFHNKTTFLKGQIKNLITCIEAAVKSEESRLPENVTLLKTTDGSPDGKERFVFKFNGSRGVNESCLGDAYRWDLIRRLYDAACVTYEEKIKFLDSFTCDANQNLECRTIDEEKERAFAEQATPISKCVCPMYTGHMQQILRTEGTDARGYYDKDRKLCVLKAGEDCHIYPVGYDERLVWNDFDYNYVENNPIEIPEGIDVVELRPLLKYYPCVKNSFCFANTSIHKDLNLDARLRHHCVCEPGFVKGHDGECHRIHGHVQPSILGVSLAAGLVVILVIVFAGGFFLC